MTPRDPAVMGFAKNVASLVAGKAFSAVDRNLLSAIAIREAWAIFEPVALPGAYAAASLKADEVLARYKAETEFSKAAAGGYPPALVNLGNIAFLAGDAEKAGSLYDRAYAAAPRDPAVLLAVARVNFELENYGLVKKAYGELKAIDPALADRFAYLELRGEDAARAADAAGAREEIVWHE